MDQIRSDSTSSQSSESSRSEDSWHPSADDSHHPVTPLISSAPPPNSPSASHSAGTDETPPPDGPIQTQPAPSTGVDADHPDDRLEVSTPRYSGRSIGEKRQRKPYTSTIRKRRHASSESRATKWLRTLSTFTEAKTRRMKCCNKFCFRHVNFDFLMQNAKTIVSASQSDRRGILNSFRTSDKRFFFDGRAVCVRFLKGAFFFSNDLICEVSTGRITQRRPMTSARSAASTSVSRNVPSVSNHSSTTSQASTTSVSQICEQVKKKEAIVSFLLRIAEDCGDKMPDKSETHLPFSQRQELFEVFKEEFVELYPSIKPAVTCGYFCRKWRESCPEIKVVKHSRFTMCHTCDELRTQLREKILSRQPTTSIKERRQQHIDFVARERMEYQKKRTARALTVMISVPSS